MVFHREAIGEDAKHFGWKHGFVYTIVMIKRSLGAPTQCHGGVTVVFGPIEISFNFFPVIHLFEGNGLHRSAGHQKGIVIIILDIIELQIGSIQIRVISVGSFTGDYAAKINFNLQRGVAQKTQKLDFRGLFQGHQIEHAYLQGAYTLGVGTLLGHGKDALLL